MVPNLRQENNNYRYYSHDQMVRLFIIKRLRYLGFSLEEVKEYREIIKEYAGTTWEKMKKLKKKSENLFHKKILLYKLISLENLLNVQYERYFLQNYVCVWNDLYLDNDYDDNGAFSNLFFLNKIDKGIYFADDMVLFSFFKK